MNSISFEKGRALILHNCALLETEQKTLFKALGQAAGESVKAPINVPDWDASAFDGFAVRSDDIKDATQDHPRILKVVGKVTAGDVIRQKVISGTAIRIMTGAPLPAGADCVVGFEDTDEGSRKTQNRQQISIQKAFTSGSNIRLAGEQIRRGAQVVVGGQRIGPAQLGLLASLGITQIKVIRRPVVAIIATGEELVAPGGTLSEARIFVGNSSALAGQVSRAGGIPRILGIARDNLTSVRNKIRRGLAADFIITTGGSSGGDRDLVKEVMQEMGEMVFDGLEMTPGKSTALAFLNRPEIGRSRAIHLALSGNPTAAMLTFEALIRPAILKMQGLDTELDTATAKAAQTLSNSSGKTRLVWVSVTNQDAVELIRPSDGEDKGILYSISNAQGIALIPPDVRRVAVGENIQYIPLRWF